MSSNIEEESREDQLQFSKIFHHHKLHFWIVVNNKVLYATEYLKAESSKFDPKYGSDRGRDLTVEIFK